MKSILFLLGFILSGCFGLGEPEPEKIIGNYQVYSIDDPANQFIGGNGIEVPPYIFAVGHNDDFIIAKQHPTIKDDVMLKIDTQVTNYYIVDINQKVLSKNKYLLGPYKKDEFDSMRSALKIENVSFNKVYPDRPVQHSIL